MEGSENKNTAEVVDVPETPETTEVIGVRFKDTGKIYYFAPKNINASQGQRVIVETARGVEYGFVATANTFVPSTDIVPPLRPVMRIATKDDDLRYEKNLELQKDAFGICQKKIAEHKLEMKLIEAEYTFDNNKLIFYFSAEGRVDFRELVKDLASVFHTRIELRQIGIRDEAKMLGGLGVCGRPFCCASFLSDFVQVSIKMAKEQNLSLNSAKISGTCGRLMCCLRYEHETYDYEIKRTPPVDSHVMTPDGRGKVVEISPLAGTVRVEIAEKNGTTVKTYHRDDVKVLKKEDKNQQNGIKQ